MVVELHRSPSGDGVATRVEMRSGPWYSSITNLSLAVLVHLRRWWSSGGVGASTVRRLRSPATVVGLRLQRSLVFVCNGRWSSSCGDEASVFWWIFGDGGEYGDREQREYRRV
ncbi:hypothetical protein Dimus_003568 [Dionaea muscipula]